MGLARSTYYDEPAGQPIEEARLTPQNSNPERRPFVGADHPNCRPVRAAEWTKASVPEEGQTQVRGDAPTGKAQADLKTWHFRLDLHWAH